MSTRHAGALLAVLLVLCGTPAEAEVQANDFELNLYGRWWRVLSYFVEDDLLRSPNDDTFLEPEGLALANQLLYVSGDRDADETDSQLAIYSHPLGGTLTFSARLSLSLTGEPNGWGPEGLTFNPSGSGYGSAANELVSVERDGTGRAGIIELDTGKVTSIVALSAPEDVAYLDGDGSFATLEDAGGPVTIGFYDPWFAATGSSLPAASSTNGLVAISDTFASFLTRTPVTGEFLLLVSKADPGNGIRVRGLEGSTIGSRQQLPVEPRARIPIGDGFFLVKPAFGTIEAVTVYEDGDNSVIYVGDEGNSMLHVLTPGFLVGDFDEDGDVDQADSDAFQACYTGPGGGPIDPACAPGDADADDDIDCEDWSGLIANWTGPPAAPPGSSVCEQAVPSVSAWGVAVLALLVSACGRRVLSARRRA